MVNTSTKTSSQKFLLCWVSTHLPDVPHLIMKVIDRPLSCHHLLPSVRARPLHYSVHFGPMMLQRGFWHPIGHVSEVLRETGSHRSGFCSHPQTEAPRGCHCICVLMCMLVCADMHTCRWITCLCVDAHACILYVHSIRYFQHCCCWALETGGWERGARKSAGCIQGVVFLQPSTWAAAVSAYCISNSQATNENGCTPAWEQCSTVNNTITK